MILKFLNFLRTMLMIVTVTKTTFHKFTIFKLILQVNFYKPQMLKMYLRLNSQTLHCTNLLVFVSNLLLIH